MKLKSHINKPLVKGQVWKTRAADIEIVALGKRLIHYKITNQLWPNLVSAQISGIQAMQSYLENHKASLARANSTN
jgi:hypothetical protein